MLDPSAPPRSPQIATALGHVRVALRHAFGSGASPHLLVACSGGRDSVALVGLLTLLRRSEGLTLTVGHVDHGLREGSAQEAEGVEQLALSLALPHVSTAVSIAAGSGIPARARAARRAALEAQQVECGADAIVLAHTATDQAETMFMHMCRGAGLEGLAAMQTWEAPYLRPALDLTRAQTGELCGLLELRHVDDPGNRNTESRRIWWREEVFPQLREEHPNFELAALGLARQAADAELALSNWAGREVVARGGKGSWSLLGFEALPRAVRTRALRIMCEHSGVDLTQLRRRVIEAMDRAAVAFCMASPGAPKGWDLRPGRRVVIDKNGFHAAPGQHSGPPANH